MKKFLAIILAVAMIAAFVPSAFATGTSGEEDVKIVCDLGNLLKGYVNATTMFSQLNTDSEGVFKYITSNLESDRVLVDGKIGTATAKSGTSSGNIAYAGGAANMYHLRMYKGANISFEVNVPETGMYSLDVVSQKNSRGMIVDVYVTPANVFYSGKAFAKSGLGAVAGSYDCSGGTNSDIVSGGPWESMTAFENVYLDKGRYVITFLGTAAPGDRAPLNTFTLRGTKLSEEELGFTVKYDVDKVMLDNGVVYNSGYAARDIDYDMTNGFFSIAGTSGSVGLAGTTATTSRFLKVKSGAVVAMKINVPQTRTYSLVTDYQKAKDGGVATVQIDGEAVGTYDCSGGTSNMGGNVADWGRDFVIAKDIELSAGEHTIRVAVGGSNVFASIADFRLVSGMGKDSVDMGGFVKLGATALDVGKETEIIGAVACLSDGSIKAQSDATTVYESSDSSVVKVNGTMIKAVAPGTAEITTTIGGVQAKRTVTVMNEEVTGNASLGVFSDVAGYVTVEIDGKEDDNVIKSVKIGSTVTATAKTDDSAYVFRGWKRGSRDNGVWISEKETITFPIMTNTFLTAIYEPVADEEVVNVEFYNYKGQYIETAENVGVKSFAEIKPKNDPILTGYSNPFWTLDGKNPVADETTFKKLTRIVAKYVKADAFNITIGSGISGAESGSYNYDSELVLRAETEGTWYVDGKPVAYGNAYWHCVWDDANITFDEKDSSSAPILTLDSEVKENGARLISYDANGANITEVGIIFGENAEITSFESKAAAKTRGNSQRQFTAMPYDGDGTHARGYLIYRDGSTFRVIYAD